MEWIEDGKEDEQKKCRKNLIWALKLIGESIVTGKKVGTRILF